MQQDIGFARAWDATIVLSTLENGLIFIVMEPGRILWKKARGRGRGAIEMELENGEDGHNVMVMMKRLGGK